MTIISLSTLFNSEGITRSTTIDKDSIREWQLLSAIQFSLQILYDRQITSILYLTIIRSDDLVKLILLTIFSSTISGLLRISNMCLTLIEWEKKNTSCLHMHDMKNSYFLGPHYASGHFCKATLLTIHLVKTTGIHCRLLELKSLRKRLPFLFIQYIKQHRLANEHNLKQPIPYQKWKDS